MQTCSISGTTLHCPPYLASLAVSQGSIVCVCILHTGRVFVTRPQLCCLTNIWQTGLVTTPSHHSLSTSPFASAALPYLIGFALCAVGSRGVAAGCDGVCWGPLVTGRRLAHTSGGIDMPMCQELGLPAHEKLASLSRSGIHCVSPNVADIGALAVVCVYGRDACRLCHRLAWSH